MFSCNVTSSRRNFTSIFLLSMTFSLLPLLAETDTAASLIQLPAESSIRAMATRIELKPGGPDLIIPPASRDPHHVVPQPYDKTPFSDIGIFTYSSPVGLQPV